MFLGDARYRLRLDRACRQVELHSAELEVSDAHLEEGEHRSPIRVDEYPECETIVLRFGRLIQPGEVEISLRFRGQVREDLRGLYRSTDRDQPWLATQLCPTDARRFFPCFDEPGVKACYSIRVTAPEELTVISNSPAARSSGRAGPDGGRRTTSFEPTPPLSAYLVAVAVGPFESTPALRCGSTPIRVYTLPGRQPLARFARRAAAESLERLERWFAMPHPYAKLDLLALPDFAFGAMENAGAVFFRDSVLLLDEREASAEDRMRAAETIAHEISHMWFGNLVTMAWWNDLWLNESFATWMAYEIVHDWQPEWRIWLEFIHRRETALETDALRSSHPIAPPIRTADEAHENFDAITYTKGASVLRMLERYLGARVFQKGVRAYIRRHREGAACASDLWTALSEVAGLPIEEIVAPWTLRTGYPILRIDTREAPGKESQVQLSQERFLTLRPRRTKASRARVQLWAIPWLGRVGRGRRRSEIRHLLTRTRERVPLTTGAPTWLYGNADEAGFFRVDSGEHGAARLLAALPRLSAIERVGWVGHQWALVQSGRAPIASLLDLIARLGSDRDPDVLLALDRVLARLLQRLAPACGPETEARLRAWIATQVGEQLDGDLFAGLQRADPIEIRRRTRLLFLLGGLAKSETILDACARQAYEHFRSGRALPSGLGDPVVRLAAERGDRALQPKLLAGVRRAKTPQERRRNLFALAGFDEGAARRVSLAATLDETLAPAVDRAGLAMLLLSSPRTAEATWKHLQKAWPRFEAQMPPILLARIVAETSNALPPGESRAIRAFFRDHPLAAGSRVLDQVAEELAIGQQLIAHASRNLRRYLGG